MDFSPAVKPPSALYTPPVVNLAEYGELWANPTDLGMPPKFGVFRPQQAHAIGSVLWSNLPFVAACVPTGGGKSAIPIALAKLTGWRVVILTATKALQRQYLMDFASCGMVDVRGRNNFPCVTRCAPGTDPGPEETCEAGLDNNCPYAHSAESCPYSAQLEIARSRKLVVSNYSYFARIQQQDTNLGHFDLIVLDEAHHADREICSAASIEVTDKMVFGVLRSRWPDNRQEASLAVWGDWANELANRGELDLERLERLRSDAKAGYGAFTPLDAQRARNLRRAVSSLRALASAAQHEGDWVITTPFGRVVCEPIWARQFADDLIYRHGSRSLLLSATLMPRTLHYLNIPRESALFTEYPSPFDPGRWPIKFIPGMRVIESRMTLSDRLDLYSRIDSILASRLDRRSIIPSISYQRAADIEQFSAYRQHFITHQPGDTVQAVERYLTSPPPVILASPAIDTGFNFPHDDCRLIIVPKHPVIDTRSPAESARDAQDKQYKHYCSAVKFRQTIGRAMRDFEDWCEIFLLDTLSMDHIYNHRDLYPASLQRQITKVYA